MSSEAETVKTESGNGKPIRSISRGLSILQILNRRQSVTLMEIAKETGLPYPTVCRIINSLITDGWVKKDVLTKRYSPTELVLSLASGFSERDEIVELAREHLINLGNLVNWPISLCTRVGLNMMVKCSTHSLSPFALDLYEPGYTLPILESAAGKTMLAYSNPSEISRTIEAIKSSTENYDTLTMAGVNNGYLFTEIRKKGYGIQIRNPHTNTPRKTSSIAVPIIVNNEAIATISLIIIATAIDIDKAVEDYLENLTSTANAIAREISLANNSAQTN